MVSYCHWVVNNFAHRISELNNPRAIRGCKPVSIYQRDTSDIGPNIFEAWIVEWASTFDAIESSIRSGQSGACKDEECNERQLETNHAEFL